MYRNIILTYTLNTWCSICPPVRVQVVPPPHLAVMCCGAGGARWRSRIGRGGPGGGGPHIRGPIVTGPALPCCLHRIGLCRHPATQGLGFRV